MPNVANQLTIYFLTDQQKSIPSLRVDQSTIGWSKHADIASNPPRWWLEQLPWRRRSDAWQRQHWCEYRLAWIKVCQETDSLRHYTTWHHMPVQPTWSKLLFQSIWRLLFKQRDLRNLGIQGASCTFSFQPPVTPHQRAGWEWPPWNTHR